MVQKEAGRDAKADSLGNVSAGFKTRLGDVGVSAFGDFIGTAGHGDFTSSINAGGSIYSVLANGQVPEETSDPSALYAVTGFLSDLLAWMGNPLASAISPPKPPAPKAPPVATAGGQILNAVTAGLSIGSVAADGKINGDVTAGLRLYGVGALDSILGATISSTVGSLIVQTGRKLEAAVSADGVVWAEAFGPIGQNVTSAAGAVIASSASGAILGTMTGALDVWTQAFGDIIGAITSGSGAAQVFSYGDVMTDINAPKTVGVSAYGEFNGRAISAEHDSIVNAIAGITGDVTAPGGNAVAVTLGQNHARITGIKGRAIADTFTPASQITYKESGAVMAKGEFKAKLTSTLGDITLDVGSISSDSVISAPQGIVDIASYGNIDAKITGGQRVVVAAVGSIAGSISSSGGGVIVHASENIDSEISAKSFASVFTWGDLQKSVTTELGPVNVFAHGQIDGKITAGGDAVVNTWDSVNESVTAGRDAQVTARWDIYGNVTAGLDATVFAGSILMADVSAGTAPDGGISSATVMAKDYIGGNQRGQDSLMLVYKSMSPDPFDPPSRCRVPTYSNPKRNPKSRAMLPIRPIRSTCCLKFCR